MIEVRLLDDWRTSPPPATFLNIAGQQWTISLPDDAAAERLAETLAAQPNARLVGWSGTTLAVLMLLLPAVSTFIQSIAKRPGRVADPSVA